MSFSREQRFILAYWLIGLVGMFVWVPYEAVYEGPRGEVVSASAGYSWVFEKPSNQVCSYSIRKYLGVNRGYSGSRCRVHLNTQQFVLTIVGAVILIVAAMVVVGLISSRGAGFLGGSGANDSNRRLLKVGDSSGERAGKRESSNKSSDMRSLAPKPVVNSVVARLLSCNPNLPITVGDLTQTSPLVITAKKDYVSVEYDIIRILHSESPDVEFKMSGQSLLGMGDRNIDRIDFDFKPKGAENWVGVRSYYFDITEGFRNLGR